MCYSALAVSDYKRLHRLGKAVPDHQAFEKLYGQRVIDASIKIPRALDANYQNPASPDEARIWDAIQTYRHERSTKLEAELFKQKTRQTTAQRALQEKVTKKAETDLRVSTNKIEQHRAWISDLKRTDARPSDTRIFPFWFAPVVLREGSEHVIRPMRYHVRPRGFPPSIDKQRDGLYNARRDNIVRYWQNYFHLFGDTHAAMLITGFFENVPKHKYEHRDLSPGEPEKNLVIAFDPLPAVEFIVPCLWSRWEGDGEVLESFAAVTDEPPPEVAATGHDRCVISLRGENLGTWLNPTKHSTGELDGLLGDQQRYFFEHIVEKAA